MKLEIPVKVYFDDVQGMIDEIKRLQTYKLFEGDDMVLVDLDAVVAIMANHVKADKCSETPNGWIPCSERLPENEDWVMVTILDDGGDYPLRYSDFGWYLDKADCWIVDAEQRTDIIAWMPLPEPWKGEEE